MHPWGGEGGVGGEEGGEPASPEGRGSRAAVSRPSGAGCGHMPGLEHRSRGSSAGVPAQLPSLPPRERQSGSCREKGSSTAPLPERVNLRASKPGSKYLSSFMCDLL